MGSNDEKPVYNSTIIVNSGNSDLRTSPGKPLENIEQKVVTG
jgi:hypothetical protein